MRTYQHLNELTRDQLVREVMELEFRAEHTAAKHLGELKIAASKALPELESLRAVAEEVPGLRKAVEDAHAEIARLTAARGEIVSAEIGKLRKQLGEARALVDDLRKAKPR